MNESLLSPIERSRKTVQVILQHLAATGQVEAARAMAVHESTVSRLKADHIDNIGSLLTSIGLKVVPTGMACFDPEYVAALKTLANVGIRQAGPQLDWSETA